MGKLKKVKSKKEAKNQEIRKAIFFDDNEVKIRNEETWKAHVEWATGGRNGGTCQRPDIVLYQTCEPCEFVKYCLCSSKSLSKKR